MIAKESLKQVIRSNEEFIVENVRQIVKRESAQYPDRLNKVVIFYGIRRSGKTFILYDLFKKFRESACYLDFEDDRLQGFTLEDFDKLKESVLELNPHLIGEELVFLFDEVQNVDGWEKFCRRAAERENARVFVSGSSSRIMPYEIHTELRGRAWSIEVTPFSFREYLHIRGVMADGDSSFYGSRRILFKRYFSEYLKWGGFPEVSLVDSELEKKKLLDEYMRAMFFRDLVERYNISNISLFDALNEKLFSSFSTKLSLNSFYKQYRGKFPFSKDLLFRYYKYFINSMLVFEVRKFAESSYKRLRNPPKIYLADVGLCRKVSSEDLGRLLENVVFLELKRRGAELFYFEEGRECDFICKAEENVFWPIQVTVELGGDNRDRELRGLVKACKWLGKNEGVVLTYDEESEIELDGVNLKVLPVWKWILES